MNININVKDRIPLHQLISKYIKNGEKNKLKQNRDTRTQVHDVVGNYEFPVPKFVLIDLQNSNYLEETNTIDDEGNNVFNLVMR